MQLLRFILFKKMIYILNIKNYVHFCILTKDRKRRSRFVSSCHYASYFEQGNLNYAYLSVTLYAHVPKRPSVPVEHWRCNSNLLKNYTATNIVTRNFGRLNDKTDFKLQNLSSKMKRPKIEILGTAETH